MRCVILLFLLINSAFADVVPPETKPLIERKTEGGFVPETRLGHSEKIALYANGQVFMSFKENANAPWEHYLIATVSDNVLFKLNHVVANTVAGELEFTDDPECTDAPVTTYSAYKADGEIVILAQEVACKMGYLPNINSYAVQIILDGLGAFNWLDIE